MRYWCQMAGGQNQSLDMRTFYYLLILLTIVGICAGQTASFGQIQNAPNPKITVHLSVPNRIFKVGEVIHVEVRVSNKSDAPVLVANTMSIASGGVSCLDFELIDALGHVSPVMQMIADYAPVRASDENAASKLLSSFALLYPSTSLLFDLPIDGSLFKFLGKPGKYRLSATYASNGISYAHNRLGLSDDVLKSLPYQSWSSKISTNEVSFTVASTNKTK